MVRVKGLNGTYYGRRTHTDNDRPSNDQAVSVFEHRSGRLLCSQTSFCLFMVHSLRIIDGISR